MNTWSKDPDLTFGNIKIQPLYSKQYPHVTKEDLAEQAAWYAEELSDNNGRAFETPYAGVYLIAMFWKAFRECCRLNPKGYVIAFMALLTWYKCCRAGEVKYDNWSEYNFNTYLQCLETQKHQQKILHTGLNSVLVFNREDYLLCTLFWMGLNNFFGEGLRRDFQDVQNHNVDSVFPSQRSCKSAETARRVGNFLKNQLPDRKSTRLNSSHLA